MGTVKTGMHTPACWESPRWCICPGADIVNLTVRGVALVPESRALPGHRIDIPMANGEVGLSLTPTDRLVPTGKLVQTGNVNPAGGFSVSGAVYQQAVARNNELVERVAFWKRSAYWATALAGAAVLASIIVIGWL